MTYFETVDKAAELTVLTDSVTGAAYLDPYYKCLLREMNIHLENDPDDRELGEALRLVVKKLNAQSDKIRPVLEWLYEMVIATAEPAVTQEENELMKNMLEYMEQKERIKEKEAALDQKEKALDVKEDTGKILPFGINFAKKKP